MNIDKRFFGLLENRVVALAAFIVALSAIGGAFAYAYRNRPVLKPSLDTAIQGAKDYSDRRLSAHEEKESALILQTNLESKNDILKEILKLESLHHEKKEVKLRENSDDDPNDTENSSVNTKELAKGRHYVGHMTQ